MKPSAPRHAVTVAVPGKIMLAGEYAILRGGQSLSASVDAHLTLDVSAADDFRVRSDLWPEEIRLDRAKTQEPLLDSLQFCARHYDIQHALIEVRSQLAPSFGLGSSSAVRLAAHLGLLAFAEQRTTFSKARLWSVARDAWQLQRAQQGFASGYDLVTQLQGGYLCWQPDYQHWPGALHNQNLPWLNDWVHPYAGGQGAPTAQVGGSVKAWLEEHRLWSDLQTLSDALIAAFLAEESEALLAANRAHRQLFQGAPFYPADLYKGLASLSGFDRSWTFKTTGAGGEDAILLIGHRSDLTGADQELRRLGWHRLMSPWSHQGSQVKWKDSAHD